MTFLGRRSVVVKEDLGVGRTVWDLDAGSTELEGGLRVGAQARGMQYSDSISKAMYLLLYNKLLTLS